MIFPTNYSVFLKESTHRNYQYIIKATRLCHLIYTSKHKNKLPYIIVSTNAINLHSAIYKNSIQEAFL